MPSSGGSSCAPAPNSSAGRGEEASDNAPRSPGAQPKHRHLALAAARNRGVGLPPPGPLIIKSEAASGPIRSGSGGAMPASVKRPRTSLDVSERERQAKPLRRERSRPISGATAARQVGGGRPAVLSAPRGAASSSVSTKALPRLEARRPGCKPGPASRGQRPGRFSLRCGGGLAHEVRTRSSPAQLTAEVSMSV